MADMRKAPDADGNIELFTDASGMECHDPTRAASQQYIALLLVCRIQYEIEYSLINMARRFEVMTRI